jgi:hypothetical protein
LEGLFVGAWGLMMLLFASIGLAGTVLWIWAIIDCAMNEPSDTNDKVIWILIILFTHWIGALIYILVRRPKRQQEIGI